MFEDSSIRPTCWMLVVMFVVSVAFPSITLVLDNDQFDRVSRGWQIVHAGAVPFRDFFDPGYFLALYSSAFVQWTFGHNLFGEVVLASAFMAVGITLLFRLATEASRSVAIGAVVALVAMATQPRLYDYDKVCFWAAGVWLCWRYADRQSVVRLVWLAIGTVVAGLYRVDNGLYLIVAAAVSIVVCHWPNVRLMHRRVTIYAGAGVAATLPVLLFLSWHGGIGEAMGQVMTYAAREGSKTVLQPSIEFSVPNGTLPIELEPADRSDHRQPLVKIRWRPDLTLDAQQQLEREFRLNEARLDSGPTWFYRLGDPSTEMVQRIVGDPNVEDTAGIDRGRFSPASLPAPPDWLARRWYSPARLHLVAGWFTRENAIAWLYYTLVSLPLICLATLAWRRMVAGVPQADGTEGAKVAAAAALTLAVDLLILRDPIQARYAAVSVPAAVLAACLIGQWRRTGTQRAAQTTRGSIVDRAARRTFRVIVTSLGSAALALTCLSVGILFRTGSPLNLREGPTAAFSSVPSFLLSLTTAPPSRSLMPGNSAPVAQYLRTCTNPTDRLLLGWFAPEVPYFAGRSFAGGMLVYFNGHWAEPARQHLIVERLLDESVPIAILRDPESFQQEYPQIYAYVHERYDAVGPVEFGDGGADNILTVFVLRGLPTAGTYVQGNTTLPCFSSDARRM